MKPEEINFDVVRRRGAECETRSFALDEVRVEPGADGIGQRIIGHAAVFDLLSEDLGGFREKISPGAFAEVISTDDVRALFNHDDNMLLGRNKANTLSLAEDEKGLRSVIDLPDTQLARDLAVLMARGDVNQMSFAFEISKDGQDWEKTGDGPWIRTIKKIKRLWDVSVVTFPAYPQTDAAVRAMRAVEEVALAAARTKKEDEDAVLAAAGLAIARRAEVTRLVQRHRLRLIDQGL